MLTHFAAVVLVVLAFLALYLRQLRYGEASTPNQRGAAANAGGRQACSIDHHARRIGIGVLLAFSPSLNQVEAYLDSSREHFAKVKTQQLTHSIY